MFSPQRFCFGSLSPPFTASFSATAGSCFQGKNSKNPLHTTCPAPKGTESTSRSWRTRYVTEHSVETKLRAKRQWILEGSCSTENGGCVNMRLFATKLIVILKGDDMLFSRLVCAFPKWPKNCWKVEMIDWLIIITTANFFQWFQVDKIAGCAKFRLYYLSK